MADTSTIAVVDDDGLVRSGVASLLRSSGLSTSTFASARAFLSRDRSTRIDLLITDYWMLGMTGVELIEMLRLAGDPMPVIIITALAQPEIAEAATAAGAFAFLRKPFDHAVLLELVRRGIK